MRNRHAAPVSRKSELGEAEERRAERAVALPAVDDHGVPMPGGMSQGVRVPTPRAVHGAGEHPVADTVQALESPHVHPEIRRPVRVEATIEAQDEIPRALADDRCVALRAPPNRTE